MEIRQDLRTYSAYLIAAELRSLFVYECCLDNKINNLNRGTDYY